jgi:putative DNA methylase
MVKTKGKSKKELLAEQIAAAVGAGREVAVETVDFSDPNRPKTCLEVDFPIIPINQIAVIEGNAGRPIYQMSKWWARRRSSVFRSMLLAAAIKAPEDESKAAKAVWDVYYANHQKRGTLRHLRVADPFMGGGTTIVEGSRLGMQMFGCDLNPVAWFVVKNEMEQVDIEEVKLLLADIEAEVKPLIMPYYACDGPNGEKGKWFRRTGSKKLDRNPVQSDLLNADKSSAPATEDTWEELPAIFDIFSVAWQERKNYRYEGPEIIYTFWAKHGPCQREGCGHRTPIMSTPVVAIKTLTTDAWPDHECPDCGKTFDVERHAARMAPDSPLFVAPDEKPFAVMDQHGRFACPHCGKTTQDERAFARGDSSDLGKAKNKKVELALLIHPQWLKGCPKHDEKGREYGGSATDSVEATIRWNNARAARVRLLEVRGLVAVEKVNKKGERNIEMVVPPEVNCPETKLTFFTDERGGTLAKKSTFACAVDGSPNDVLDAINGSGKTGPIAPYTIQAYSRNREQLGLPYGGRFFSASTSANSFNHAMTEWEQRKSVDLSQYWPRSEVMAGLETSVRTPLHKYHYHRWADFFTPLQLLVHSQLLKAITSSTSVSETTKDFVLGAFQQYLRNNNLFCIWDMTFDKLAPFLSKNNMQPPARPVENSVFQGIGRGNWLSCVEGIVKGLLWKQSPWELVPKNNGHTTDPAAEVTKSERVLTGDAPLDNANLYCSSATEISRLAVSSIDLVVTDPPFGDIMQYAELSTFFYVWLRCYFADKNPELFGAPTPPLLLEAVENSQRHGEDSEKFYQRALTESWKEAYRILKPYGILAFTFHHDKDAPWVAVLESLFDAGFYLEATYPTRSDETKGEGGTPGTFGAQKVEYDIIHVFRKRMTEPQPISWARLRRLIVDDVRHLKRLLEQHRTDGLPAADLDVIRRGKALEHFSRHYGQVYIEREREFGIREALPAIKQIVDEESDSLGGTEALPANAEPYTRQFFRLFYETTQVPRDQMQKFLRGTGIAPSDFVERGWCSEKNKVFTFTPPVELARAWKGASRKGMARDFDQTLFLVGGCIEGSNIRVTDTLDSPNFAPHPATSELVEISRFRSKRKISRQEPGYPPKHPGANATTRA